MNQGKLRSALSGRRALLLAAAVTVAGIAQPTFAKGKGNNVVVDRVANGTAAFSSRGNQMIIRASDRAIINYKRFDIPKGASVRFIQPSATSRLLNRINSERPSLINGKMTANGIVYFVNPAGFVFGEGSVVNATQIFAAAGSLTDANFLAGVDHFENLQGRIINFGSVEADSVTFVGELVANHGTIVGGDGVVTLASGNDILIGREDGHIFVRVDQAAAGAPAPGSAAPAVKGPPKPISNGLGAGDVYSIAVRNSGHIKAKQVQIDAGKGVAAISGKIDVSNKAEGATGGRVEILGDKVLLAKADIKASGHSGGGTVLVGGDVQGTGSTPTSDFVYISGGSRISADALVSGNGGKIVVFANDSARIAGDLRARGGAVSGNGGFIETSGKKFINVITTPDVTAKNGAAGQWLIDPFNIFIVLGAGNTGINAAHPFESTADNAQLGVDLITAALNGGATVTITTGASATAELGDITLNTPLDFNGTGAGTLSLIAHNDININGQIFDSDTGTVDSLNLTLTANSDALNGGAVTISQPISLGTGTFTASGASITLGNSITSGTQTYNAPVTLATASVNLNAGAGNVVFANTLALADNDLTITAAEIDFNGGINSVSGGGNASNLVLQPSAAATAVNVGIAADGANFDITDADIAALADGLASLTIGRADGTAAMEVTTASFVDPVTLRNNGVGGTIHVAADGAADGITSTAAVTLTAPTIQLQDNINSGNGTQTFNGDVTLQADTTLTAGSGDITFNNGITGAFALAVNSSGTGTFEGAVNIASLETDTLGFTDIDGQAITTTGNQTYNDVVTLGDDTTLNAGANEVNFETNSSLDLAGFALTIIATDANFKGGVGSVGGGTTSSLVLQPTLATSPITIGFAADAVAPSFDLLDSELAALTDGLASITIGRADGTHAVSIESAAFRDPVTIQTPLGGSITVVADGAADGITGIGNASVSLTAPAITLNDNITTAASQTFTGPVTLGANTALDAGAGTVAFGNSLALGGFDLTITAAEVNFSGVANSVSGGATTSDLLLQPNLVASAVNVGIAADGANFDITDADIASLADGLASLTIGRADGSGALTVSSATFVDPVTLRSPAAGGSITVATDGAVDGLIGTGDASLALTAPTITLNDNVTSAANQTYTGAVSLGTNVTLDAGAGTVTLGSTTLGGSNLTITAAEIDFTGGAGSITGTGNVTLQPNAAGTAINVGNASNANPALDLTDTDLAAVDGTSSLTIGRADGTGAITVTSATFTDPATLRSPAAGGSITVSADAGDGITGTGDASLTLNAAAITLSDNVTTAASQTYNGPATLGADVALSAGAGTVTFANTLALGGNDLTITAAEIDFTGGINSVSGGGENSTLVLQPDAAATAVNVGGAADSGAPLDITDTDLAALADGLLSLSIGRADATSALTVTTATFVDPVTLRSPAAGGSIVIAAGAGDAITGTSNASVTLTAPAINLNDGINTSAANGAQTFNGPIALGADVTLESGAGAVTFNNGIIGADDLLVNSSGATTFNGIVDIARLETSPGGTTVLNAATFETTGGHIHNDPVTLSASAQLDAGSGAITFASTVSGPGNALIANTTGDTTFGSTVSVGSLTTDAGGTTNLNGGTVTTNAGAINFNDAVVLGLPTIVSGGANNVTFASTVTGPHSLVVNSSLATRFNGAVNVDSLSTNAGGTTILNGGTFTTVNGQLHNDAVTLESATTLNAGAGDITFNNTLDGNFALIANSTGTTHFDDPVSIGSLTTNTGGTTHIDGGSLTTTGNQIYNDTVTLPAGATTLSGANVTFNNTIAAGTAALTVNSSGTTTFGNTVNLSSLTTDASGTTALNGGTVATSAGQVHNDPVTLGTAATLNAGAGAITFAQTVTGAHALNANSTGATTFGGAVNVASVTTNAGGTTNINGGSVITTGNQIYNDAVALGALAALTSSTGTISFASTLDLNGHDLTLTAVDIDITGPVTDGQGTSDVTIQPVSALAGINVGLTDADPTTMDISDTDLAALAAGLASLTIGRSNGQHAIEVQSISVLNPIVIRTPSGGFIHNQAVAGDGIISTGSVTLQAPSILMQDNVTTTDADQTYDGPVTFQADFVASAGTGDVLFESTLGGNFNVTINATGATTFDAAVNLGSLTTDAGGTTLLNGGTFTTQTGHTHNDDTVLGANTLLTANAGNVLFDGTVTGAAFDLAVSSSGTTTFSDTVSVESLLTDAPGTTAINGGAVNTFTGQTHLDPVTLGANTILNATTGAVTFGQTLTGPAADLIINSAGTTTLGGAVTLNSLTTNAGGSTAINGGLVTTTGATGQVYSDTVTLGDHTALSAGAAPIFFAQSITGGSFDLAANTSGLTTFNGPVTTRSLTTDAGGTTALNGGTFTTTNNQIHNDVVTVGADALLEAGSGDITFAQTVTGAGADLIANSTGTTTFQDVITLASLTTNAGGTTVINGGLVTTTAGQTHNDPVTFGPATVLNAGAGNILFAQSVNSANTLDANSTGTTTFGGPVTVAALTTNAGGTTALDGGLFTTTGGQVHNDAVTVGADATLEAGAGVITFASTVTGASADLVANTSGLTSFNGAVTLDSLTTDAAGTTALNGGSFTTSTGQVHNDNVTIGSDAALNAGSGPITFAQTVLGATADLVANSTGTTTFNGVVTLDSLTTNAGGTTALNGGIFTTTTGQIHNDAVTLGNNATLNAGAGVITFDQTVTGAAFDLVANSTGTTTFNGAVTVQSLTTNAGGTTALNGGTFTTTGGQIHNDAVTVGNDATLNAGAGVITFAQTVTGAAADLVANSTGTTTFNGAVTLDSLTTNAGGTTALNGGTFTTTNGQVHNDAVTLGANATLNASGGAITFDQTVTGAAFDLVANSTGTTTFNGVVTVQSILTNAGGTTILDGGTFNTTAGQIHNDAVTLSNNAVLNAGAGVITFDQTVTGAAADLVANSTGTTTFNGVVTLDSLTTNAGGTTALNGGTFTTTSGQIHNDAVTLGNNATLNAAAGVITFADTVTGAAFDLVANSTGLTTFGDVVTVQSIFTNAGGTAALNGGTFNTTAGQVHDDVVTIGTNATLNASAGPITFQQTVTGASADLVANSTGTTTFNGAVTLDSLTTNAGGTTALNGGSFTTTTGQTHNDAVTVGANATLSAGAGPILFGQTVTGASADLVANSTGTTTFNGAVTLDSLTTNAGGTTALNGGSFTTTTGQTHNDAVTVGSDATLNASAGNVTFASTVTGASADLLANSTGTTTFGGAVTLASLATDAGGTTALNGGTFTTTAGQIHNDPVTVGNDATLNANTGQITFAQTVTGAASDLVANSSGTTSFAGAVNVASLSTNAGGNTVLSGGTFTTSAGQSHGDSVILGANTLLSAGSGPVTFANTLTGPTFDLRANSSSVTTFGGAVSLDTLITDAGGTTALNGGSFLTRAGQTHLDNVTLGANANVTANNGNILFGGTVNGTRNLDLNAARGTVVVRGNAGSGTILRNFEADAVAIDVAGLNVQDNITLRPDASASLNDPDLTPGLVVIRNSLTSQGGVITLSPDQLGTIPDLATIVAAPNGGSTLVISSPGGSISLGVHQKFSVRQNPGSGSGAVNLTVQADTVTLGDVNVEGDFVVEANNIRLLTRAATPQSADQGLDFVVGGSVRMDGNITLVGDGARPIFGSGTGFGDGDASQFLFFKVGDVAARLRANDALAATPDLTPLAADLRQAVNVNLATAIAGAVPRDIPRPQQEAGVSAALREDLIRMGIEAKDLTIAGIMEALSGRSLYEDLPKKLSPEFRDIQVTTDRLYYKMSMEVIQAYRALYAPRYFNQKTGQIEVRNNVENIKATLNQAVKGYADANPNLETVDGNELRKYIEEKGTPEAKKLLVDLRNLLTKLQLLGLTETEQRGAERKLLGDILPEDLTAAQLRIAIMGSAATPAPATKPTR